MTLSTKALSISTGFTSTTKEYDGTTAVTITTGNLTGVLNSDSVTATGSGNFDDKNVGSGKTITATYTLSGNDAANYSIGSATTTGSITAKALTISGLAGTNKEYDGTTTATINTSSIVKTGLVIGDTVTVSATGAFNDKNVGNSKTVTITSTYGGADVNNYTITDQTSTTANISAKSLTISGLAGTNKEYDGTTTATINTSSIVKTGLVIGDTVTVSATGAFNDKNVGNSKTVTITSTYGGADVNNYTITDQTSTTANISAKALTIATSFTSTTKEYDGTTAVNITTSNLSGVVTGENVTASGSGSFDNKNVGSGKTITATYTLSGNDAANYSIGSATTTGSITAKTVTLSASKVYDGTSSLAGDVTISTGITGEALSYTGAIASDKHVATTGKYISAITLADGTGGVASNYALPTLNNANAPVTITKATLSASGSQAYNGTASFSGSSLTVTGVNGEAFTATGTADLSSKNAQTNQHLANVNGLTLTGVNTAVLSDYNALTTSNTSVTISPLSITLTAPSITKIYDGGYTYTMTTTDLNNMSAQLVGGDNVSAATVVFAGSNPHVGNKAVTITSATINDGNSGSNYSVTYANGSGVISAAPLTIKATDWAKFVTQSDPSGYGGVIYNGFVNGETVSALTGTLSIARSNSGVNTAGDFTLTPSGFGVTNGDYAITYQTGTFTIVPAQTLLITASPSNNNVGTSCNTNGVCYGIAPTYSVTAKYLESDNVTITTLTPSITNGLVTVNDGVGGLATLNISPSNATTSGSGNINVGGYNLTAANVNKTGQNFTNLKVIGSVTINPLKLSASDLGVTGVEKVYDGNNIITGLNLNVSRVLSNILTNDVANVTGSGTFSDANVGTTKSATVNLSITGADKDNYVLTSNQLISNIGTITQLASVTYVGASGGNWSNANNWAGGAIPTLSNVAQVIIPVGSSVVFDYPNLGSLMPTSTITDNGTLSFEGSADFTLTNQVSGSGVIDHTGAGNLTLSGNNSHSGGTNIHGSHLTLANNNALGTGALTTSGGSLSVANGLTLPSLTVNGAVTLDTNISTVGTQTYNGGVTINGGSVLHPIELATQNADITFNSTLVGTASSFTNQNSLKVNAGNANVTFNDAVGWNSWLGVYYNYSQLIGSPSLYQFDVIASSIFINANITTFDKQRYYGAVVIGNNGTNGTLRKLVSEDPDILFNSTVDDQTANTNDLQVFAIAAVGGAPTVTFNGNVGSNKALKSLTVSTGIQNPSEVYTDISQNQNGYVGTIALANGVNVTTLGNQVYNATSIPVDNTNTFNTSPGYTVQFNSGVSASPYNASNFNSTTQVTQNYNGVPPSGGNNNNGGNAPSALNDNYVRFIGSDNFERDFKIYFDTLKNNLPYLADVTVGDIETVQLKTKCNPEKDKTCVEQI